jgi:hypothetical protein
MRNRRGKLATTTIQEIAANKPNMQKFAALDEMGIPASDARA